jgi:hypothetical protein
MKKLLTAGLIALACSFGGPSLAQPGPTHNTGGIAGYDSAADAHRQYCVDQAGAYVGCGGVGGGGGGDASAAKQDLQTALLTSINAAIGVNTDAACSTDNGTCDAIQLAKRGNQRLSSIITALGSPFQAGGSIGNTSFGISGLLPAFASTPTFNIGTGGPSGYALEAGHIANVDLLLGAKGDTVCASNTGSCSLNAQMQRLMNRVDLLFASGGSIGNASFGATPVAVTPTDKGGTITTGGTAQNAMASNSSRKGGWIQNPCSATESLFVSTSTSATTTGASDDAELPACASFSLVTSGGVIQSAVSVNAATTAHRFIAKEVQ